MANQPKKYKKFVATAATATLVASAIVPVASAASFSDIAGNTHADAIKSLADQGIVNGYADGTFKPNTEINRGQTVKLLGRWLETQGYDIPADWDTKQRFNDLPVTAEAELVKYAALVKDAGVFNGSNGNLNYNQPMQRQQMAVVLVRAIDTVLGVDLVEEYKAADFTTSVKDLEKAFAAENREAIVALEYAGITVVDNFRPADTVTRGQFASFLYRTIEGEVEQGEAKITGVKAINDTTIEVKFGKALDSDFIREAERNGQYFVVYKYGESLNGDVIQSESISFSADGKSAEFTVETSLEHGERYYVVLVDGDNPGVANVVQEFGPAVLLKAADAPKFEVSAVADKIYIEFSEKMKESALEVDNYTIYDNGGQELGDLADFVTDNGEWTNATQKKVVEFTLAPTGTPDKKQLRAGETYKIKLETDLETDSNKKLNKDNTTITVKTPSVKEAAPKAAQAIITNVGAGTADAVVAVIFDKDVNLLVETNQNLKDLVQVKTSRGKKVNADEIYVNVDENNANVLNVKIVSDNDPILDKAISYNIELPANLVNNAVFPNAANQATTGIKATAQDNVEIKSLKAQFVADPKVKGQANLLLTFDQRPDLDYIKAKIVNNDALAIIEGTTKYHITDFGVDEKDIKFYGGDASGKTVVVEGINQGDFDVFSNKTYTVELAAGSVRVDAYGTTGVTNQTKLKSTINGMSVTAPVVDKVTLVSAKEIKVEFEEAIDSNIDLNKIEVAGFEADGNGFYASKTLTGKNYLETSVSGNTLTIKAKKSNTAFATGVASDKILLTVKADAFTTKGTNLEVEEFAISDGGTSNVGTVTPVKVTVVDNAAPVLAHASEVSGKTNEIAFTFTEAVVFEGTATDVAKLFRTGGDVNKSSVGYDLDTNSEFVVKFDEDWKGDSTNLLDVTVDYKPGQTTFIKDAKGNKVKATTLKGIDAAN